jgi:hypothetical protein
LDLGAKSFAALIFLSANMITSLVQIGRVICPLFDLYKSFMYFIFGSTHMKIIIALISVWLLFVSCIKNNQIQDGVAAIVDQGTLDSAALATCSVGQTYKSLNMDFGIYADPFPSHVLFAIQKGAYRCASINNIDHGGLLSWLKVTPSTDCILNGSLWEIDSFYNQDGGNVYLNLKSLNPEDSNKIRIFTNYGYSMLNIRSEVGLIAYSCSY